VTLGIICQKMLCGLTRLWQYVVIPEGLWAGIDRERRRNLWWAAFAVASCGEYRAA
jgi:hypothetical protein